MNSPANISFNTAFVTQKSSALSTRSLYIVLQSLMVMFVYMTVLDSPTHKQIDTYAWLLKSIKTAASIIRHNATHYGMMLLEKVSTLDPNSIVYAKYSKPRNVEDYGNIVNSMAYDQNVYTEWHDARGRATNIIKNLAMPILYYYFVNPRSYNKDITALALKTNDLDINHKPFATTSKSVIADYNQSQFTTSFDTPVYSTAMQLLNKLFGKHQKHPFTMMVESCSAIVTYETPEVKNACVALLQLTNRQNINVVAILTKRNQHHLIEPMRLTLETICSNANITRLSILDLDKSDRTTFKENGYTCVNSKNNMKYMCSKLLTSSYSFFTKKASSRKTSSKRSSSRKYSASKKSPSRKSVATRKSSSSSAKTI